MKWNKGTVNVESNVYYFSFPIAQEKNDVSYLVWAAFNMDWL